MRWDMKETCKHLNIDATEEQLIAGNFLESRGQRFCVDFGYENAIAKADDLLDLEIAEIRVQ